MSRPFRTRRVSFEQPIDQRYTVAVAQLRQQVDRQVRIALDERHEDIRSTMADPQNAGDVSSRVVARREWPTAITEAFFRAQSSGYRGGGCHSLRFAANGCKNHSRSLQSFTGKRLEMRATDLYKHLNGLIGDGQVRLLPGASDGDDAIAVARFLFRIGFLEVRYKQDDRFEVRDAMRHPDHWKSIRKDDGVVWAVRSAFYCALRSQRLARLP